MADAVRTPGMALGGGVTRREDLGLSFLLAGLLVTIFVVPLLPQGGWTGPVTKASGLSWTLIAAAVALGRRWLPVGLVLGAPCIFLLWIDIGFDAPTLLTISRAGTLVFLVISLFAVLGKVFRPGPITGHRVRGAIAAYLMLGLAGTFALHLVYQQDPTAFRGLGGEATSATRSAELSVDATEHNFDDLTYFSFVTLLTLGYGEIAPVSQAARSLSICLGLSGQLFLAILIARLVALQTSPAAWSRGDGTRTHDSEDPNDARLDEAS